ncbi:MAG: hypothetical protein V7K85_18545 [Nostoc sp.]
MKYSKNTSDNRHSVPPTVTIGFSHFHFLMLYLIQVSGLRSPTAGYSPSHIDKTQTPKAENS